MQKYFVSFLKVEREKMHGTVETNQDLESEDVGANSCHHLLVVWPQWVT